MNCTPGPDFPGGGGEILCGGGTICYNNCDYLNYAIATALEGILYLATNATVSEWMDGWVGTCVGVSVTLYIVDTIENTVFVQLLSIFTCTLWMTRGLTLLILVHMVKHQGQMWHFVYKTFV